MLLSIESFTDSSIFVRLKKKGLTNVIAYTDCGIADTTYLVINATEKNIDFKSDTLSICKAGDKIALSIPADFKNIRWSTGSNQPEKLITEPGKYWVTAMDDCGISFTDTIHIVKTSNQNIIPNEVNLCLGDSFKISKVNFLKTYDWAPKIGVSEYADYFSLSPAASINYQLMLEDVYGCKSETKLTVNIEKCIEQVWFPNSFTPNGDGLNDQFGGTGSFEPEKFELTVFDRWGQKVFNSHSIYNKWNGNVKGKPSATGACVWICCYKFLGK